MQKQKFRVIGSLDTETTSTGRGSFVCLLQLRTWKNLKGKGATTFYSTPEELVDALPMGGDPTPIIAVYNLQFDFISLEPVLLEQGYELSSFGPATSPFYIDVLKDGQTILRFWEVSRLCPQGLAVMGELAGLPKLNGEWDYSIYREPGSELTKEEKSYAVRDTEVIQAYLNYILRTNNFVKESDLGTRLLTQTGLVRLFGERVVGRKELRAFRAAAAQEEPEDEEVYRLRKACFRAGLTFTGGANAGKIFENVTSIDTISMHHSFILGRLVPRGFHSVEPKVLERALSTIFETPVEKVLAQYEQPFGIAIHARVRFTNLRIKAGSVFEAQGIGTLARGKFAQHVIYDWQDGDSSQTAENRNRLAGYLDKGVGLKFEFGKLISAQDATLFLTELEAWVMAQVYDWEGFEVLEGEITTRFQVPPTYILKLDEALYSNKCSMKSFLKGNEEAAVPQAIKSAPRSVQEGYYLRTSKGMFNSIFGLVAMDSHKYTDEYSKIKAPSSWYTMGMRIAGGSRVHLVIAMLLINQMFKGQFQILGGDTDSIKLAGLTNDEIQQALEPLHTAITKAIAITLDQAGIDSSQFAGIGTFESEGTADLEIEVFNKNRLAWTGDQFELTAAGIPTPPNRPNLESALTSLAKKYGPNMVMEKIYGPNLEVDSSLSCFLFPVRPTTRTVNGFAAATSLIPTNRLLGDLYSPEMSSVRNCLPKEYAPRTIALEGNEVVVRDTFTQELLYSAPLNN